MFGEGNGNPLQCSCLENPRDGSLVGCRLWGRTESDTTEATQQQQQHKEKEKFEDVAKADQAHCERDMKTCISLKGETNRRKKSSRVPKRLPSAFFLFYSEFDAKLKGEHLGLSIGDVAENLGEMRSNTAADDKQAAL